MTISTIRCTQVEVRKLLGLELGGKVAGFRCDRQPASHPPSGVEGRQATPHAYNLQACAHVHTACARVCVCLCVCVCMCVYVCRT